MLEFFDYIGTEVNGFRVVLTDVTNKKQIFEYPAGTKFDTVIINFKCSTVTLINFEKEINKTMKIIYGLVDG